MDGLTESQIATAPAIGAGVVDGSADFIEGYAFRSGETHWLDTSGCLCEVVEDLQLHDVAGTSDWFAGLANYRGYLLPVTDLRLWLGLPFRVKNAQPEDLPRADSSSHRLIAPFAATARTGGRLLIIQPQINQRDQLSHEQHPESRSVALQFALRVDEVFGYRAVRGDRISKVVAPGAALDDDVVAAVTAEDAIRLASIKTDKPSHAAALLAGMITPGDNDQSIQLLCDLSTLINTPVFTDIRNAHLTGIAGGSV